MTLKYRLRPMLDGNRPVTYTYPRGELRKRKGKSNVLGEIPWKPWSTKYHVFTVL